MMEEVSKLGCLEIGGRQDLDRNKYKIIFGLVNNLDTATDDVLLPISNISVILCMKDSSEKPVE